MKRQWQARVRNWIGAGTHGLKVTGVRRRGRGPWKAVQSAPTEVQDFLFGGHGDYVYGSGHVVSCKSCLGPDFKRIDELPQTASNCKVGTVQHKAFQTMECTLSFEVDEKPAPERLLPITRQIKQLAVQLGVVRDASLFGIYRALYKVSTCGVSVGFLVSGLSNSHPARPVYGNKPQQDDPIWIYCDSLQSLPLLRDMPSGFVSVVGICITGYVEGWDGELERHILKATRSRSLTVDHIWRALNAADEEAGDMWDATHGCPDCGSEDEFGNRGINPQCKTCHGEGMIL